MITIRHARGEDSEALQRLFAQVDRLHAALHPRFFAGARRAPGALPSPPNGAVFVALVDGGDGESSEGTNGVGFARRVPRGTIVGAAKVRIYDTPEDPLLVEQRRGYVDELVVDEAHRRAGIGRRLMEEVARWCRERGAAALVLTVWSGNEEAEAFYQRLGYRVINRVLSCELD